MAMVKPDVGKFLWWWGLQEPAGSSKIDYVRQYSMTELGTPARATGHASIECVDLESGNPDRLTSSDSSWNTFGNESKTFGIWWNAESFQVGAGDSRCLFAKFDKDNDHEYGAYFDQDRPYIGIARGGHVWETTCNGSTGALVVSTWYLTLYSYNASTDKLKLTIYNTSGVEVASGAGSESSNTTGFGTSVDTINLNLGTNSYNGNNSYVWDGKLDEFFCYDGIFSADEESWIINGGDGRQYSDLIVGGVQIWYNKIRDSKQSIEELWKRNQRLKGLTEALPA